MLLLLPLFSRGSAARQPVQHMWRARILHHRRLATISRPRRSISGESQRSELSPRQRDLLTLSALEITAQVRSGAVSLSELADASRKQIERTNKKFNAYVSPTTGPLIADVQYADRSIGRFVGVTSAAPSPGLEAARPGLLAGVPLAVKDSFSTRRERTTAGSAMLAAHVALYDAAVVQRARQAGALLVGKTGMDEFGMGSTGAHSAAGPARNPWNSQYAPGGSSSGSAAAVAALCAPLALGSDTGGSVRLPAAFSGLVGLKPSYGLLSRRGLVAYASSLDCPGVLARNVPDSALLFAALSAPDLGDATALPASARPPLPDPSALAKQRLGDVRGLKVGLPREYHVHELTTEARLAWEAAARWLEDQGAVLQHVSLPHTRYALPAYYIIACAEASSNLARYDGVRYGMRQPVSADTAAASSTEALMRAARSAGLGTEVQRRILLGTLALSRASYESFYVQAQAVRRLVARDFAETLSQQCDVLLTPAACGTAPRLGGALEPTHEYAADVMTIAPSLAGLPAVVLPVRIHTSENGAVSLPLGVQLVAARLREQDLLRAARAVELSAAADLAPHFAKLHRSLLE